MNTFKLSSMNKVHLSPWPCVSISYIGIISIQGVYFPGKRRSSHIGLMFNMKLLNIKLC